MADYLHNKIVLSGCVNTFCLTFELAWKAMKAVLSDQGVAEASTGSPKQILEQSYRFGLIEDEKAWLNMLKVRNDETHHYNENAAINVCVACKEYVQVFEDLDKKFLELGYKEN